MRTVLGGNMPLTYGCSYTTTDSNHQNPTTTNVTVDSSGCANADSAMNDICVAAITGGGAGHCSYHCSGC